MVSFENTRKGFIAMNERRQKEHPMIPVFFGQARIRQEIFSSEMIMFILAQLDYNSSKGTVTL